MTFPHSSFYLCSLQFLFHALLHLFHRFKGKPGSDPDPGRAASHVISSGALNRYEEKKYQSSIDTLSREISHRNAACTNLQ